MKNLIVFVLYLHMLPLFVLGWATLFDVYEFSNAQWGIAWFMAWASGVILTCPMFFITEKDNVKK